MKINKCSCGHTPIITFGIPKKKEICHIICTHCGNKSGVFTTEHQAATIWNNIISNERRLNIMKKNWKSDIQHFAGKIDIHKAKLNIHSI